MALAYDPFLRLAEAVLELLETSGPLQSKEIVCRLRQGRCCGPAVSAVNKVLSQYLLGRVKQGEKGRWSVANETSRR